MVSDVAPALREATCPGCGAKLEFSWAHSAVLVCPYCRHAVGRGDVNLDALGKVAELFPTDRRLRLGARGTYRGVGFRVAGHAQFRGDDGAWDVWFADLDNGRWARILESEGRYQVLVWMAPRKVPPLGALVGGSAVDLGSLGQLTVTQIERAKLTAADGELSKQLRLGGVHRVVRLEGVRRSAAVLDQAEGAAQPELFVGRTVDLASLALDQPASETAPRAHGVDLTCPKCGGAIALRVPERTTQVACTYCGALLDATQGKLRFLAAFAKMQQAPGIPLGSSGTLDGIRWTVVGWMRRTLLSALGATSRSEHLLYEPQSGAFAWLVEARGHWKLGRPSSAGELNEGCDVELDGDYFERCGAHDLRVEEVLGEFYREVYADERFELEQFVCVPEQLDCETFGANAHWTLLRYVEPEVVQAAFPIEAMPVRTDIDPIQPWPHRRLLAWLLGWGLFGLVAAVALSVAAAALADPKVLIDFQVPGAHPSRTEPGQKPHPLFDRLVDVPARAAIDVDFTTRLYDSWATVQLSFVDGSGRTVRTATLAALQNPEATSKWHAKRDALRAESDHLRLGALPPGRYHLRAVLRAKPGQTELPAAVKVVAGEPDLDRCWYFLLLLLPGLALGLQWLAFTTTRERIRRDLGKRLVKEQDL